jgi:glycosyltransferase involved in cell wall biosynthesis
MRTLIFTSTLGFGGGETLSVALAHALADEGVDVHYASATGPLRPSLDARVTYHQTDNPNHLPIRVAHAMSLLLREIRPDVIHSHGATSAAVATIARKASKVSCPRVLTHHSGIFRTAPLWFVALFLKRCADHYIAISHGKQTVLEGLGIPREKISYIPNGVDVEKVSARIAGVDRARVRRELGIPTDARVLMMAGRVLDTKRFDSFIRIAAESARRLPQVQIHALVVGDGPDLDQVRKVARDEGAPATIHFLGYQRDIYPSLAVSDLVVFPSAHPEVLPMFLIEASAAGRAIVCSDIPANREIVSDGITCRVIHGDTGTYAAAVVALLDDESQARRLAAAAHANAREHFDQYQIARETIRVYEGLLAAREPKG